jgi:hypothetical protein
MALVASVVQGELTFQEDWVLQVAKYIVKVQPSKDDDCVTVTNMESFRYRLRQCGRSYVVSKLISEVC